MPGVAREWKDEAQLFAAFGATRAFLPLLSNAK
jgi:hypothetical protein